MFPLQVPGRERLHIRSTDTLVNLNHHYVILPRAVRIRFALRHQHAGGQEGARENAKEEDLTNCTFHEGNGCLSVYFK